MHRIGVSDRLAAAAIFLAALCGRTVQSVAQQPAQQQPPAQQRPPRVGDVDLANSRVFTFVGATGFGHEHAVEGRLVSGSVNLGATQNAGELVFDMRSFDADTPAARKYIGLEGESDDSTRKQVNDNMLGADVLDVVKFPTAKFAIQSATRYEGAKAGSPPQYLLDGRFTLHGVTKHLRILAETEESEGMVHLRSRFSVLQSQFGITPFTKLLGTIGVADKLTIYGDAWIYGR
jgi:polyisoprenoid-binding protein YceI